MAVLLLEPGAAPRPAAHVLTSTAFDVSDDELDEGEEIDEELLGGDGPLAVSYAVDDDTDED